MARFPIRTGTEFIFARLHGLWSRAFAGENLRKISNCLTEDIFFQQLQAQGFEVNKEENFQRQLARREIDLLQTLGSQADSSTANFIKTRIHSKSNENLKVLLNFRFFPRQELDLQQLLIPVPGESCSNLEKLLEIEDLEEFIDSLPQCYLYPTVPGLIRKLKKDKDFNAFDCAIDNISFQEQIKAAGKLKLPLRATALELLGFEIDIINLCMLLRNAKTYHLDKNKLNQLWIAQGKQLKIKDLKILAEIDDYEEIFLNLPAPFAKILQELKDMELYHSEHRLWNMLAKKVHMLFRNFNNPGYSILAYLYLLHFESLNLGRIYEGIRFGMPPAVIEEMMIGLN